MSKTDCDNILMAAMAVSDGEETTVAIEQIKQHIAGCESCRLELEQAGTLVRMLGSFDRREMDADLWQAVSGGIVRDEAARLSKRGVFAVVATLLTFYKLAEMLPHTYPGHFIKIAPVVMAVALFIFLKENPFKINTELTMEQ
jgi:hypothetical protein